MKKPLIQYSLLTLFAGALVASCLVGANLAERERVTSSDLSIIANEQVVIFGWPFEAARHEWSAWNPQDVRAERLWSPIQVRYDTLAMNVAICLATVLAATYSVEWFIQIRSGTTTITNCRGLKLMLAALAAIIIMLNCQRPLCTPYSSEVIGVCWGWPQGFIQINPHGKILASSVHSLWADFVFGFAVFGLAARVCAWLLRYDRTVLHVAHQENEAGGTVL